MFKVKFTDLHHDLSLRTVRCSVDFSTKMHDFGGKSILHLTVRSERQNYFRTFQWKSWYRSLNLILNTSAVYERIFKQQPCAKMMKIGKRCKVAQ